MKRHELALTFGSILGIACAPGAVAQSVRPTSQTAAQATGEASCKTVSAEGRPLVVDWKPEQRGDLEVAMSQGVAVVAYDCGKLELLADCRAEGTYGFKGVSLKQQLIRLSDSDEIKVNLPLGGPLLAAKLEGGLGRGTTLDLATALVGNRVSTRASISRADLTGRCDGATHFVRGANIGAFVMETGEQAQVKTAAQVFGASASGQSQSSKLARQEDGTIESCKSATSDGEKPPGQCGALVRLHLVAVADSPPPHKSAGAAKFVSVADEDEGCPAGLVLVEGKCARAAVAAAAERHVCKKGDVSDCEKQCAAGEGWSCSRAGSAYVGGAGGVAEDQAKASSLFKKSCELGHAGGCANMGVLLTKGANKDDAQAAQLFDKACAGGDAVGCFDLGALAFEGRGVAKDAARATKLFKQACDAGNAAGCVNYGAALDEGAGVTKDPALALKFFQRACEGDKAEGCTSAGASSSAGGAIPEDAVKSAKFYARGCNLGSAKSCEYLGKRHLTGKGVDKDVAKGKELLDKACTMGDTAACEARKAADKPLPPPSAGSCERPRARGGPR